MRAIFSCCLVIHLIHPDHVLPEGNDGEDGDDDGEDGEEGEGAQAEDDGSELLEISWEVLDVARVIYSKAGVRSARCRRDRDLRGTFRSLGHGLCAGPQDCVVWWC